MHSHFWHAFIFCAPLSLSPRLWNGALVTPASAMQRPLLKGPRRSWPGVVTHLEFCWVKTRKQANNRQVNLSPSLHFVFKVGKLSLEYSVLATKLLQFLVYCRNLLKLSVCARCELFTVSKFGAWEVQCKDAEAETKLTAPKNVGYTTDRLLP